MGRLVKTSNHKREVIQKGYHLTVCSKTNGERRGGGRRGEQHGHRGQPAKRLEKKLLGLHAPEKVFYTTFPDATGPENAATHIHRFYSKLKYRFGKEVSAIAKLEIQPLRHSAEFAILLWVHSAIDIDEEILTKLWNKTIGEEYSQCECKEIGHTPEDWIRLAAYFSKKVEISIASVSVKGRNYYLLPDTEDNTYLVKESQKLEKTNRIRGESKISAKLYNEWQDYTGRFHFKYNEESIPEFQQRNIRIPEPAVDLLRSLRNSKRKKHFIGRKQAFGFSLNEEELRCLSSTTDYTVFEGMLFRI